jgi:hypothetical protein
MIDTTPHPLVSLVARRHELEHRFDEILTTPDPRARLDQLLLVLRSLALVRRETALLREELMEQKNDD